MLKNPKFTNLFVVSVTEFLMMYLSLRIIGWIYNSVVVQLIQSGAAQMVILLALFIIPSILCLIYMKLTYPGKLRIFTEGGKGRSLKAMGIGLAIGFAMNLSLCLLAAVSGSVKYTFTGFGLLLIPAFFTCFIQCAAEEVLIRGYVSSYLEERYQEEVVAFTGGVLFVLHHINNLTHFGFDTNFCFSVFLMGILLYLAVKLTKSVWAAFGIHTAWNYTQSFIFGSENSGMASVLSVFSSSDTKDSFFCNTVYGNEGTDMCVILIIIVTIVMYLLYKRQKETGGMKSKSE